ncbi:BrnA antitoxin family protein [Methylobacterium sp. J-076]|uniref:BrnA antitoxin family protein n=1 Tax=Methylobacterium sp. J-076 TaxID=2836655 RepID=UPI001FBB42D4|nr:BrnA antitoxin family protein [Methylobacterium sp. J-076]MCJ2014678.1 BrnA antitoxin family protein [Methylobacterium sp. J-076]
MTGSDRAPGYEPNPAYSRDDWDEVCDNPELSEAEIAQLRPAGEGLPPFLAKALQSRGGRPKAASKRVPVSLRIDPDVLATFKETGPGWQTRMNDALAEAAKKLKAA